MSKEVECGMPQMFVEDPDGNLVPNPDLVGRNRVSEVGSNPPIQETDVPKNEQPQKSKQERTKGMVFSHFSNPDP